jgi:acetylornithine/N-succinyldiaminopimelate aminotransferase
MEYLEKERRYLAHTYRRQPIALVEGKGAIVKDSKGKEYIDCFSGLASLNIGHSHPKVVEAIKYQCEMMMHSSNVYHIIPQIELAELLFNLSGGYKSFVCNSGTEANEAALKLARKHTRKTEIIAMKNSFHGRTFGSLSATGQEKYKAPFKPMLRRFKHVKFGDAKEIEKAISKDTACVIIEPIQGEGGVIVPPKNYLKKVREICDQHDVLLILDEVQTGFGRVGEMFAFNFFGIKPDIFTVAKALGGGFPIGCMLAKPYVMDSFDIGDHGSTFGGNHLACVAAKAAIEVILEENLVERSRKLGEYFMKKLKKLKSNIREVRGLGLMIGIELKKGCEDIVDMCRERGILLNCTQERVLRFLPPLVIKKEQLDMAVDVLEEVLNTV